MFTNKKLKTHKNRPVLGLNHRDADATSVTINHRGVDIGSVYRNNTNSGLALHLLRGELMSVRQRLSSDMTLAFVGDSGLRAIA